MDSSAAFAGDLAVGTKFFGQDTEAADSNQKHVADIVPALEVGILVDDRSKEKSQWIAREEAETDTEEGHGC